MEHNTQAFNRFKYTRAEVNLDWCDLSDNPRDNRRLGSSSMASVARPMYEPVSVNDKSDARYWLENVGKKPGPVWKLFCAC